MTTEPLVTVCAGKKHLTYLHTRLQDIERAASLGSNCFRTSVEWSRIEPQQGVIDQEAVARYNKILDCLDKYAVPRLVRSLS